MKNKTINILEDNRGNIVMTLGTGKDLIQTQNENLNENVIDNSNCINIQNFCFKKYVIKTKKKAWQARDVCHTYLNKKSYPLCIKTSKIQ